MWDRHNTRWLRMWQKMWLDGSGNVSHGRKTNWKFATHPAFSRTFRVDWVRPTVIRLSTQNCANFVRLVKYWKPFFLHAPDNAMEGERVTFVHSVLSCRAFRYHTNFTFLSLSRCIIRTCAICMSDVLWGKLCARVSIFFVLFRSDTSVSWIRCAVACPSMNSGREIPRCSHGERMLLFDIW